MEPGEEDESVKNEPHEASKYLPESKPKSILKDESIFDEALQGSSFNTPKPQRKVTQTAKKTTENAPKIPKKAEIEESEDEESTDEEEESSEEETETES